MDLIMRPIGVIHSPFHDRNNMPIQPSRSDALGSVEVYPEYSAGLQDIDGFSHIYLLYAFHRSQGYSLMVTPFLDDRQHGLFSTRHPCRPNPLGLSVVRLLSRQKNILEVGSVDVLDGTPLLDIKPYIPEFEVGEVEKTGWYSRRARK